MTLTPEQFNKLATKEDLRNLEERIASKKDMDNILTAVDAVVKKLGVINLFACAAFVAPLAARQ